MAFIFEEGGDYTEYRMWEEINRILGYRDSLVNPEGAQDSSAPGADPNIDNITEGVDNIDEWGFAGTVDRASVQSVGVKRKLIDLRDECRAKQRRFPTNVAEGVGLAQEIMRSDTGVNVVMLSDFTVTTNGDATTLAEELDKAIRRIASLESMKTITVLWNKEFLDEATIVIPMWFGIGKRLLLRTRKVLSTL